ncbi:ABC transporter ATP-binding protein [Actinokineospora auranticolor]|uniref:ATP-binding cassette subfamily B protein n=1 Tax=Actinokineospora auranticolor TaxID=155976 RepID=A0A2S6H1G8_9PSEU|nr:ABC transporter ATP-binding protein [Actinokineospora auranticolor]PPK71304.1 ATP-binding cassette subfamily B protein [Actinokineospora auranticolor]
MTRHLGDRGSPIATALRAGRGSTLGLVLVSAVNTAVIIAVPALLGAAIDAALERGPGDRLVLVVVGLLVVGLIAESLTEVADFSARTRALRHLRLGLLGHVFTLGFRGQRGFTQGDLLNRLTDSTDQTAQSANLVTRVLVPLLTSLGGIVALFVIDFRIGLAFLLLGPVFVLLTLRHIKRITTLSAEAAVAQADVATRLTDAIRGLRTIRASGTVDQETERVLTPARDLRGLSLSIWRRQRRVSWETAILAPLLQVSVLAVAGWGVLAHRIGVGEMLAASAYLAHAMGIFAQAGSAREIGQLRAAAQRLRAVADAPGLPGGTRPLPDGRGALGFRGVGARVGGRSILRDVTFEIPPGSTVAVVGESGVGKTTLTALAGGLLAPDTGTVTLDGAPIGDLRQSDLRRAVVYAFERPNLLGLTIADALRYGDPDVPDARLRAALRSAGAEEFVARLPAGVDTPLDGLRLSGGEVQRLGLARAACRSARLIVMDDALSSVDTATEAAISAALHVAARGCTRLLIAHRVATAARADFVVWLHAGTVAGIGTHRELLNDPLYRAVFAVREHPAPAETGG